MSTAVLVELSPTERRGSYKAQLTRELISVSPKPRGECCQLHISTESHPATSPLLNIVSETLNNNSKYVISDLD